MCVRPSEKVCTICHIPQVKRLLEFVILQMSITGCAVSSLRCSHPEEETCYRPTLTKLTSAHSDQQFAAEASASTRRKVTTANATRVTFRATLKSAKASVLVGQTDSVGQFILVISL